MGTPYWVTEVTTGFPFETATAWCNEGDFVLGGGFDALAFDAMIRVNRPVEDGSYQGWEAGHLPTGSTVYAICANIEDPA